MDMDSAPKMSIASSKKDEQKEEGLAAACFLVNKHLGQEQPDVTYIAVQTLLRSLCACGSCAVELRLQGVLPSHQAQCAAHVPVHTVFILSLTITSACRGKDVGV